MSTCGKDLVVKIVEYEDLEQFGFFVFRMDYEDDAKWDQWFDKMIEIVDESIARTPGGEKIEDKSLFIDMSDNKLQGKGWREIADRHDENFTEQKVPPGAHGSIVLAVDKYALDSLLSPKPDQRPWVWAVDTGFPFAPDAPPPPPNPSLEAPTDPFAGYFPWPLESILTVLWPTLMLPESLTVDQARAYGLEGVEEMLSESLRQGQQTMAREMEKVKRMCEPESEKCDS